MPGPPQELDLAHLPLERLFTKRKALRRRLTAQEGLLPVRLAILGGSTTQEFAELLELHLLDSGFAPILYQSEYGRFEIEALHDPAGLIAFQPDALYLHTSVLNLTSFPPLAATSEAFAQHLQVELTRFEQIWTALDAHLSCTVIQNTFELPPLTPLGNLDHLHGESSFVLELNRALTRAAAARHPRVILQDVHGLSARIGLDRWFDLSRYCAYKLVTTPEASNALALSLAALVRGLYGKSRKLLVLDLDNTLWGGVIGDDGLERIEIGRETAVAEAYTAFQRYCLALRERGILLAVCSKNDDITARSGFTHPDSILRLEHFAAFRANWLPKPENLVSIAEELSLGLDSFVFVDDNPAERALVTAQLPQVAVPDIGPDVTDYPRMLDRARYFEQVVLSPEDLARASHYQRNTQRQAGQVRFADYGAYLDSLQMSAEIAPFLPAYLDRIAQLTNKTNQFNLTTRRYTRAELEAAAADPCSLTLYARLTDRFGDNGLVSVVLGRRRQDTLVLDLWLMSCRVLKRDLELAMLDALVARAIALGITAIEGTYIPSRKNSMVAQLYPLLGFKHLAADPDGTSHYMLPLSGFEPRNRHIAITALT